MAAEHQCIGVLHSNFHSVRHLVGLTFKKPTTSTNEDCVSGKDALTDIFRFLVVAIFNRRLTLCIYFTQVKDVTSCVARGVKTGDLYVPD